MTETYTVTPVGWVRKKKNDIYIEIEPLYREALLGIEGFSHLMVFYWFHENDTADRRSRLQVHPRADRENPLTGVFATHAPYRPNLIALSVCRLLGVEPTRLIIEAIDARDGSPVIDLKCYIPYGHAPEEVKVPQWVSA